MIYQMSSGRAIEITIDQYLDMSDTELKALDSYGIGETIEDPWFGSTISKYHMVIDEEEEYILPDLTVIPIEEKLIDLDIEPLEEE